MNQNLSHASFVADMMLGRLVRWMRVLGYDVLYRDPVDDAALIALAREQGRVLLTRDTRLVKRRGVGEHLLIRGNDAMEQLKEVTHLYAPSPDRILSRCIRCNALLISVVKRDVKEEVPEHTYYSETDFARCPKCGRVFWHGTHTQHMLETCQGILDKRS